MSSKTSNQTQHWRLRIEEEVKDNAQKDTYRRVGGCPSLTAICEPAWGGGGGNGEGNEGGEDFERHVFD